MPNFIIKANNPNNKNHFIDDTSSLPAATKSKVVDYFLNYKTSKGNHRKVVYLVRGDKSKKAVKKQSKELGAGMLSTAISNKLYYDGGHYVSKFSFGESKGITRKEKLVVDFLFAELYKAGRIKYLERDVALFNYIKKGIVLNYGENAKIGDYDSIDEYILCKLETEGRKYRARRDRFYQKTLLCKFTHFATFTYDPKKWVNEVEFRDALKKTLANFYSRRGWLYAGMWEKGGKNDRLHLHALLFVPTGQEVGITSVKRKYNHQKKKMETWHDNSFFSERFGRNDFSPLNAENCSSQHIAYIGKYMTKSDQRILYSHGLPTDLFTEVTAEDISAFIYKTVTDAESGVSSEYLNKLVVYDDMIIYDWYHKWHRPDGKPIDRLTG